MSNKITETLITTSEEETRAFGKSFAKGLKPGDVISLEGDLGTGKTAFTKGIAAGLGIPEDIVSPTFTLVNTYTSHITLHHFDVYRIDDPDELLDIGWDEYLSPDAVCIVEWGDRIPHMMPPGFIRVTLSRTGNAPDERKIVIERKA